MTAQHCPSCTCSPPRTIAGRRWDRLACWNCGRVVSTSNGRLVSHLDTRWDQPITCTASGAVHPKAAG